MPGFAHFFATKAWNRNTTEYTDFGYYKEFLSVNSSVVRLPPVSISTNFEYSFEERHNCIQPYRSTEGDWLRLFWQIHTIRTGGAHIPMSDIYSIIDHMRANSPTSFLSYSNIASGAYWGLADANSSYADTVADYALFEQKAHAMGISAGE